MTHKARIEAEWDEPLESVLRRLYENEELTQAQVAQRLGIPQSRVCEWMIRYRIPSRPQGTRPKVTA